jgi:hypothetical protein
MLTKYDWTTLDDVTRIDFEWDLCVHPLATDGKGRMWDDRPGKTGPL